MFSSPPGRRRRCASPPPSAPGRARRSAPPWPDRCRSSGTSSGSSRGPPPPGRWTGRSSGTRVARSTVRTTPVPLQVRQAPWQLKASSSADGASKRAPHAGQTNSCPAAHRQGGGHIVPVGTAVAGQPGVHQAEAVQKLRPRAEGAPDPGHAGRWWRASAAGTYSTWSTVRLGRLGHPAAGIGGQGLQIAPGTPPRTGSPGSGRISPSRTPPPPRRFRFRGTSTSTFFKLWTRAPRI